MEKLKHNLCSPGGKYLGTRNLKIIKYSSTNRSEIFFYDEEKDIFSGFGPLYKSGGIGKKGSCTDEEKIKQNQKLSGYRATAKIKKLIIENNLKNHCVTTYKDSLQNRENTLKNNYRDMVLYDDKLFLKKLSYRLKHKIDYVAVPEYQIDRFKKYGFKFLHMHIALPELVDERFFWSVWNSMKCMECDYYFTRKKGSKDFKCGNCKYFKGVISVKNDDMDLFKISNYFTKYFTKGFDEKDLNQRKFNQKRYLSSKDLKNPQIIDISITEEEFNKLILPNCIYIKSMGTKNDVGSRAIIDNDFIDKYLHGEKNDL